MNVFVMRSEKVRPFLLICLILFGGNLRASDLTLQAGLAYYPNPELSNEVLVEFPFTVNRHEFEFYQPDTLDVRLFARVYAEVKLFNASGIAIDSAKTYFSSVALSTEDATRSGLKLFDNLMLMVPPGEYTAKLTVIDVVSKSQGIAFYENIQVEPINRSSLALGGPLLAYKIKYVGEEVLPNRRLVHNGLLVHTNPLGVYSTADKLAYLYAELYNIQGSESDSPIKIEYRLESELGQVVIDWGYRLQHRAARSIVVTESLDIGMVLAGTYFLRVMISDSLFDQSVVKRIPLLILDPQEFDAETVAMKTADDPYDTLSFQDKLNIARYELNPEEQATLDRLSDDGKLNFLDQFWTEHDDQPLTSRNEKRDEIIVRYIYANQTFSTALEQVDGWSTDRGRIYISYGEPDRIQSREMPTLSSPNPSQLNSANPYEVWTYFQIEEGKEVVFVDAEGFDDYRLVHSTFDGELYSEYWHSVIKSPIIDIDK